MSLTDRKIAALKPPFQGQEMHWDSIPGFGVRISHGGTKTFILIHGRNSSKKTIGRVGVITLAQARQKAREILAEKTLGLTATSGPPIKEALQLFLSIYKTKNRASTYDETARLLNRHLSLSKRVGDVTDTDLDHLLADISAPSERRHAFVALKTFWNWCVKRRLTQTNPLLALEPPQKGRSRERVLGDEELAKVLSAARLEPFPYGRIVELLILTGQRVGQIVALHSDFIDRRNQTLTWPAALMKGDRPHTLPLTPRVAELLGNTEGKFFPFNNFSNAKRDFDAKVGIAHWTLHDLRRTARTNWAKMKVPPHISERILAHRTGGQSEVAAVYDRYLYLDEMREALTAWEDRLHSLVR